MDSVPDLSAYMINNCNYRKRKKIWEAVCDTFASKFWDQAINDLLCKKPVIKVTKYRSIGDYKLKKKILKIFKELFEDDTELTDTPVTSSLCEIKHNCDFIVKLPLEKLSKTQLNQLNNKSCLNVNLDGSNSDVENNVISIDDRSDSDVEILQNDESHNNLVNVKHELEPSMNQLMHELAIYCGCTTPTYDISSSDDEENEKIVNSNNVPLDDHKSDNHFETNSRNLNMMNESSPASITDTNIIQNNHHNEDTNNERTLSENVSSVKETNVHNSVRSPPPAVPLAFWNSFLPNISPSTSHDFTSVQAPALPTIPTTSFSSVSSHSVSEFDNSSTQLHSSNYALTLSSDRFLEGKQQAHLNELDNSALAVKQFLKVSSSDSLNKQLDHPVKVVKEKVPRKQNLPNSRSKQPLKRKIKDFKCNENNFQPIDSAKYTKYNTVNTANSIVQNIRKMSSPNVINNSIDQSSIHNNNTNNFSTFKDYSINSNEQFYSADVTQTFPGHSTYNSQSQQTVHQKSPVSLQLPFPTPPYQDGSNNYVPEIQKQPLQQQPYAPCYSHSFPSPPYSEYSNGNSNEQTSMATQSSNINLQASPSVQKNSIIQHQNPMVQQLHQVTEKQSGVQHNFPYQPLSNLHPTIPKSTPLEQYPQTSKNFYNYSLEHVLITEKQQPHSLPNKSSQHSAPYLSVPQNSFPNGLKQNSQFENSVRSMNNNFMGPNFTQSLKKDSVQFSEAVTCTTGQQPLQLMQNTPQICQDQQMKLLNQNNYTNSRHHDSMVNYNKSQLQLDGLCKRNLLQISEKTINSSTEQNAFFHSGNHPCQPVHNSPQNFHHPQFLPANQSQYNLGSSNKSSDQAVQNYSEISSQKCCSLHVQLYHHENYSSPQSRLTAQLASCSNDQYNQTISYTGRMSQNMQNLDYIVSG